MLVLEAVALGEDKLSFLVFTPTSSCMETEAGVVLVAQALEVPVAGALLGIALVVVVEVLVMKMVLVPLVVEVPEVVEAVGKIVMIMQVAQVAVVGVVNLALLAEPLQLIMHQADLML
jgi:hypothetical protein